LSQAQPDLERTVEDLCNTHDTGAIAAGIKNVNDLLQRQPQSVIFETLPNKQNPGHN